MTTNDAVKILNDASEALSHASYCAITGSRINHTEITNAWDKLRDLIKQISPDNSFLSPGDKNWVEPTMTIKAIKK